MATILPQNEDGGFLFAITDPSETLIQFGLSLSPVVDGYSNLTLYYSNYRSSTGKDKVSQVAATFSVPLAVNVCAKFTIKVQGKYVTLHWDCAEYEKQKFDRVIQEMTFDPASTIYVGQAGNIHKNKFVVSILVLLISLVT